MADAPCKAIRDMHQRHHGNEKRNMKMFKLMLQNTPDPPQKLQHTKSLTPQFVNPNVK